MSKSSATETLMGTLHSKVAAVMVRTLDGIELAQAAFEEALKGDDAQAVLDALGAMPQVSPAFLSAATKFLADNKITCQTDEDENIGGLAERLAKKREDARKKSVGNIIPFAQEG